MEELLIALGSAVLSSVLTLWVSRRQFKQTAQSLEMQRQALELELQRERERVSAAHRAELVASSRSGPIRPEKLLVVSNRGAGHAMDVQILLDGTPVLEHDLASHIPGGQEKLTVIAPGDEIAYRLLPHGGSPPTFQVEIQWVDESGRPGQYRNYLHI